jgi:hypothetical protein
MDRGLSVYLFVFTHRFPHLLALVCLPTLPLFLPPNTHVYVFQPRLAKMFFVSFPSDYFLLRPFLGDVGTSSR